jgi:hypothetical protein
MTSITTEPMKAGGTPKACFFLCSSFSCKVNATSVVEEGGKPPMATPNLLQNSEVVVDTTMLRLFSRFASLRCKFVAICAISFGLAAGDSSL